VNIPICVVYKDKLGLKNDLSDNSIINSEQRIAGLTAKFIYSALEKRKLK
jgi:hypothetical protein